KENTSDISRLINPGNNKALDVFSGVVMCIFLLCAYTAMTAAGGALLETLTGLPSKIGSIIYFFLCMITCIGGFESVSAKMGKITPILVCVALVMGVVLTLRNPASVAAMTPHETSKVATHWLPAAVALVGYNGTAALPVLGQCAVRADSMEKVKKGAMLGGIILGLCCLILYLGTSTDPAVSADANFPMQALCTKLYAPLGTAYSLMLLLAIFMSQTACFYGFTTKIDRHPKRVPIIWVVGSVGYLISLLGFKNFVANVYSVGGYISLIFFALEIVHFIKVSKAN
ncbi:MAG: hypothetical protein MJ186_01890, partial [Clostridia bacterium]|nr:hypothetical protein [Clostridia bacterium]